MGYDFWIPYLGGVATGLSALLPIYTLIIDPAMKRFMDKIIKDNRP